MWNGKCDRQDALICVYVKTIKWGFDEVVKDGTWKEQKARINPAWLTGESVIGTILPYKTIYGDVLHP